MRLNTFSGSVRSVTIFFQYCYNLIRGNYSGARSQIFPPNLYHLITCGSICKIEPVEEGRVTKIGSHMTKIVGMRKSQAFSVERKKNRFHLKKQLIML